MRISHQAFQHLKEAFTTAPVLKHPDPEQPYIIEVDASETGVGAILSQCFRDELKMHLASFPASSLLLSAITTLATKNL